MMDNLCHNHSYPNYLYLDWTGSQTQNLGHYPDDMSLGHAYMIGMHFPQEIDIWISSQ